jgi:hypothetical protein
LLRRFLYLISGGLRVLYNLNWPSNNHMHWCSKRDGSSASHYTVL